MNGITFDDILIKPQYSAIKSRQKVDLSVYINGFLKLKLPVISSNMKHVTGARMPSAMRKLGGLGIQHRLNSVEEAICNFKEARSILHGKYIPENEYEMGVSVGVNKESKKRFDYLYQNGARLFCVDVAHGHHILVKEMIYWIKENYNPKNLILIAGNVATAEGAFALHGWGADLIKVGIGPGAACTTRRNTGVGVPQFSALKNIREAAIQDGLDIKLISDGGVKTLGDFAKALIYADMVMVGKFIAGTSETPGKVFRSPDDELYKVYGGSASGENKLSSGQKKRHVEGIMQTVSFKGHVSHLLQEIKEGLQSAFSYSGSGNLDEFHDRVQWERISSGTQKESKLK